jgi:hypothetical protein
VNVESILATPAEAYAFYCKLNAEASLRSSNESKALARACVRVRLGVGIGL